MSDVDHLADMLTRSELTARCAALDDEIRDLRARVSALEKRADHDDEIRAKLREIAASQAVFTLIGDKSAEAPATICK